MSNTYYFSNAAAELLNGTVGAQDIFIVNNYSYFNSADTVVATPALESGTFDIIRFDISNTSINLSSSNISGVESFELSDNPNLILTATDAFAAANLGYMSKFYVGSTGASNLNGVNINLFNVNGSNVVINAASGPDTLISGAGADSLVGHSGNDTLFSTNGADTLDGGSGADTLFAGLGADCIMGGDGDDKIILATNDLANGESINGGLGADIVQLDSTAAGAYSFNDINLSYIETIAGAGYADSVSIGWDQLFASGVGSVTFIDLAAGQDRLEILNISSTTFNMPAMTTSFANIEMMILKPTVGVTATAAQNQSLNMSIVSTYGDTVLASSLADSIWSGQGADYVYAGDGADMVVGGSGADNLYGQLGADTLFGTSGADWISGNSGADLLVGGPGPDSFAAYSGADTIFGGDGSDSIDVNSTNGAGILVVADALGESGDDKVYGNAGNDTVLGGLGDDTIRTHGGNDYIIGGDGADCMAGGLGSDVMWGEAGPDRFVFTSGYGADLIADFQPGVDKIELSNFSFNGAGSFTAMQSMVTVVQYGNGVVISFGNGDVLSVVGLTALNASDFVI